MSSQDSQRFNTLFPVLDGQIQCEEDLCYTVSFYACCINVLYLHTTLCKMSNNSSTLFCFKTKCVSAGEFGSLELIRIGNLT